MKAITLIAIALSLVCSAASATTYYVRPDGSDANSGTASGAASAWATIGHAASVLSAGDMVYVAPGTYAEGSITPANEGVDDANRLVFQGDPTASQFADISAGSVVVGTTGHNYAFDFNGKAYMTLDGMEITGTDLGGVRAATTGTEDNIFSNLHVHNVPTIGLDVGGQEYGGPAADVTVRNCVIHDTTYAMGAYSNHLYDGVFDSNTIYNVSVGFHSAGALMGRDYQLTNNLFENVSDTAIDFVRQIGAGEDADEIVNNTFVDCQIALRVRASYGGDISEVQFYNNIVTEDEITDSLVFDIADDAADGEPLFADYNDYNVDAIAVVNDGTGTTTYTTLAQWQALSWVDEANSVEGDPVLNADYYPTAALAIDSGDNAEVMTTTDHDGNPRIYNGTVDMGAFEVPEPAMLSIVGLGFGGLLLRRRRG